MTDIECDVLIVGARVAGATLATLLGQDGRSVLLVDSATFPSQTLSTHFFRGQWGVSNLRRLGVLDELLALGPPRLERDYFYLDGAREPAVSPPQDPGEPGFGLSVRREPLDATLVRRASREPTVTVLEGTRFLDVIRQEDGRVVGARLRRGAESLEVRCRFVVGADGRHSTVAESVGAEQEATDEPSRALYYQYVRGFGPPPTGAIDGAEFSLLGDQMAYVFPSDSGVACVAVTINRECFREVRTAPSEKFGQLIAGHPAFAERFAAAEPVDRVVGCGAELHYVRAPFGTGWALVGDASLHLDPWTGRGIDFATTHAGYLAEALSGALGGADEGAALSSYRQRRDDNALEIYRQTNEIAKDLRQIPRG